MPSRKQRRRREKLQRHEYEYVVETDEGDEEILEYAACGRADADARSASGSHGRTSDRRGRPIQPPSVARVLKRGAIFGPLLLVVTYITAPSLTTAQKIFNAVTSDHDLPPLQLPGRPCRLSDAHAAAPAPAGRRLVGLGLAAEVTLTGPRREQEEDAGAAFAAHEVALVRLEVDERSHARFELVAAPADPG